jgi:hypothetical protein
LEKLKSKHNKWRWLIYNNLDEFVLNRIVSGDYEITSDENYYDNSNSKLYTREFINNYIRNDFYVDPKVIQKFDNDILSKYKEMSLEHSIYNFAQVYSLRSKFIENCLIITDTLDYQELINKIKKNIIYYHWCDILSFEELSHSIIDCHFLASTIKLIGKQNIISYLKNKFDSKNGFIDCLLNNFTPREFMINEMNSLSRGNVIFDYNWLFINELTKSIRIVENNCRIDTGQKIVGSFYNEDLLFREIKNNFEKKHKVISQGSPEWLGLQRFDIYFPELNIAIEYQGEQHQRPVDFGGKGKRIAKQQFNENLKRDKLKKEKSDKNNCELIYVFPDYNIKNVLKDIKNAIHNRNKL